LPSSTPLGGTHSRVYNFNAGPGALPLTVLERIRSELVNYGGTGMSVMEMSHRSSEFEDILTRAEQGLRRNLTIPEEYAVVFLQGGGSLQFAMIPMNLYVEGKPVDVLHTGVWTAKAMGELKGKAQYRLACTTEAERFRRLPRPEEIVFAPNASYIYLCTNNTIEGTEWGSLGTKFSDLKDVPLVADMSSDILSRSVDIRRFGLIFAGAQKNLGPSGVTIVIVRRDLAERANKNLPTIMQYRTHIKEGSLYHTPPTFAVYIVGLMMDWIDAEGGVAAITKRNEAKAKLLYEAIEVSGYYTCPVEKDSRSRMNIVFRIAGGNQSLEGEFVQQAAAAGLVGLAGHRSVGGIRASLYNAVTLGAVEALASFMREFQRTHG